MRVKVCGITRLEDALFAVECGADALGFIFWNGSKRNITPEEAGEIVKKLPPFVTPVGVFVNEDSNNIAEIVKTARLGCIQLHGEETPETVRSLSLALSCSILKAFRVKDLNDVEQIGDFLDSGVSAFLLDSFKEGERGGTGKTFDWELALHAKNFGSIILSGGLNAENVGSAIKKVSPYGVDVSSGVEDAPGKKNHKKIKTFIERAKEQ
ncbi:MAG: phosphoribosylanthranilate isomerase [Deltaproteobacteria bacterium]|nr:phosphoribosylanthranilate isomerase [Deltaproteobacteria bacterium]